MPPTGPEDLESVSNHALKVVLDPDGTPDPDPLNNLMRNKKITPATAGFGATRVGDGKLFGVDAERPIHGSVFQSIDLDLGRLNTVNRYDGADGRRNPRTLVQEIQIVTDQVFRAVLNLSTDANSRRQGGQDRSRSRARRLDCAL